MDTTLLFLNPVVMATISYTMLKMSAAENHERKVKPTMELKRQAVNYYNEKNVPKYLEELLNKMFLDNPKDIYGYMAEYFSSKSMIPVIDKIELRNVLSSRGHNTLLASVFCEINGQRKFVFDSLAFFDDGPKLEISRVRSKPATGTKVKTDKKSVAAQLAMAVNQSEAFFPASNAFNYAVVCQDIEVVSEKLIGQISLTQPEMDCLIRAHCDEIAKERTMDDKISEANITAEKKFGTLCNDCLRKTNVNHAELFLSLTTAQWSSSLQNKPLYKSIRDSFYGEDRKLISVPTPIVLLMKCGTDCAGKLNLFKGIYVAPKPRVQLLEGLQKLSSIHRELGHLLHQKLGVNGRLVNADGSYSPCFERPDQVFEFLHNAAIAANCSAADEFDFVLDIGASYFYDEEKKKYEISTGNYRTLDDLLLMYNEFIEKQPIIGLIDAVSYKDAEGCSELNKQLSGKCFCFGDKMFMDNVDLIEEQVDNQACNAAVIRLGTYFNNLTEFKQISNLMKDRGCKYMMMNTTAQGCVNRLASDMATAFEATFLAIGSPIHDENISLYNRLIEIEEHIKAAGKLKPKFSYDFPIFKEDSKELIAVEKELNKKENIK